jgi:tetratricopeptide (TPR) repeat protein
LRSVPVAIFYKAAMSTANELYKQGQFDAAAAAFTELLEQTKEAPARSIIYSNRAACALALNDATCAEADCRAGLALNPVSAKLRYRLAQALWQQQQVGSAAAEIATAVALLQSASEAPAADWLRLYEQVAAASAGAAAFQPEHPELLPAAPTTTVPEADSYSGFPLPADPKGIVLVSTAEQLRSAVRSRAHFIVAAPGIYQLFDPLDG